MWFSSSRGCTFLEVLARACCLVPIFVITAGLSFCLFLCEGAPRGYFGLLVPISGGTFQRCEWHVNKCNNPSIPGCSSSKCFQQASGWAAYAANEGVLFECVGRYGGKHKHWWRLNGMELSLCNNSGGTKFSGCWFIQPGQWFPSTGGSKLLRAKQLRGSQPFPALLHTRFLSALTNHLSFLFKGPVSLLSVFQGRTDPGCGSCLASAEELLDAVYLKESQGILVHRKWEMDFWYLKGREPFVPTNPGNTW